MQIRLEDFQGSTTMMIAAEIPTSYDMMSCARLYHLSTETIVTRTRELSILVGIGSSKGYLLLELLH